MPQKWVGQKFRTIPDREGVMLKIYIYDEQPWHGAESSSSENNGSSSDSSSEESCEHECVICGASFPWIYGLFAHYDARHQPVVTCECTTQCLFCRKAVRKGGLSQHLRYVHAEKLDKKMCPICMARFNDMRSRDSHVHETH